MSTCFYLVILDGCSARGGPGSIIVFRLCVFIYAVAKKPDSRPPT